MRTIWMPALRGELGQVNAPLDRPVDPNLLSAETAAAHAQAAQQLTQMQDSMKQNADLLQKQAQEGQAQQAQQVSKTVAEEGSKYVLPVVVGGLALTGLAGWGIYKIIHG